MNRGGPVDLVFQSIAGSEAANRAFGVSLAILDEAHEAARALNRGVGDNVMYFETGQGSALSAEAHHGVDQQTMEARAYAVARRYGPLLVNTVVGFIGPDTSTTAKRSSGLGWRITSAASCSACRWAGTSATPTTPKPTRTTWTRCSRCSAWRGAVHHGRAGSGRRDAELPEHVVPRCALRALGPRPAPGARVRGLARTDGHPGRGGAAAAPARGKRRRAPACERRRMTEDDPWQGLRRWTPARIALGRTGDALPTRRVLVPVGPCPGARRGPPPLDVQQLARDLDGLSPVPVRSQAESRAEYLRRPDLGRRQVDLPRQPVSVNRPGNTFT